MYTGNTFFGHAVNNIRAVYPCVYREHHDQIKINIIFFGLSLCIQGTLFMSFTKILGHRFIPVYTGNTNISNTNSVSATVYPCVYREHVLIKKTVTMQTGLSLCIQGTRGVLRDSFTDFAVYPCVYREHTGHEMT